MITQRSWLRASRSTYFVKTIDERDGNVEQRIPTRGPLDLAATLESGQSFRWERHQGGYTGVAAGHLFFVRSEDTELVVSSPSCTDPASWARAYFDIDTDYNELCTLLRGSDSKVAEAVDYCPGLRLLRQDAWETLVCFILSQNNNIPRIKQMVHRLCSRWGARRTEGAHCWWQFPSPESLASATEEEGKQLGLGYRALALVEAAGKVSSGMLDLDSLSEMSTDEAREILMQQRGIGRKVADCVLLFGVGKLDAFPIDVWIKRGLEHQYFAGEGQNLNVLREFAQDHFEHHRGYAQNYLFYFTRSSSRKK